MEKFFTLFILVSGLNLANAQFNEVFVPNTVDGRSYSMGRTDVMSADGSNAVFSNPALLGMTAGMQIQVGGCAKVFTFRSELIDDYTDDYKNKYAIAPKLNHISFAMPYKLEVQNVKIGVGAGFYTAMDNAFKLSTEYKEKGDNTKISEKYSLTGGLNLLSVSAGLNYKERFFAGLTLNKSLFSSFGAKSEFDYGDDELRVEKTKISATSLCFGAYAKITQDLSFGINYHSKFKLNFDDTEWEEEINGTKTDDGEYNNDDIDIPAFYAIGLQYKFNSAIILVGEYHSRPFSDYEQGSDELFNDLDDGESYRFGIEFYKSKPIFRLGLFYDALPLQDQNDDKPKSMLGITAGTRFDFNNINIDGYLEYGSVKVETKYGSKNYDEVYSKFSIGISAKYLFVDFQHQNQNSKMNLILE